MTKVYIVTFNSLPYAVFSTEARARAFMNTKKRGRWHLYDFIVDDKGLDGRIDAEGSNTE